MNLATINAAASAAALLATMLAACGGEPAAGGPDAAVGPRADASADACTMTAAAVANEGWTHVDEGSAIAYQHNPPASGPHYPIWARYRVHEQPLARGYWVHNVEHGAIVLLYRPGASAALVDALVAAHDAIPADPACGHRRALVAPDPDLDDPIAVVAADVAIEADCVDPAAVLAFVASHRNMAPEDVCGDGAVP